MVTRSDLQIHIIENDKQPDAALKAQYFDLRYRRFKAEHGHTAYPDGPDSYDNDPKTVYIIATYQGKVVAGGRMLIRAKGEHNKPLRFERDSQFCMVTLMPHLDCEKIGYGELGGVVSDERLTHEMVLGSLIQKSALEYLQSREDLDVAVVRVVPQNVIAALRTVIDSGVNAVIRNDIEFTVEGEKRMIMLVGQHGVPLLSQEQQKQGIGMSAEDYYMRLRSYRKAQRSVTSEANTGYFL